MPQNIDGMLLWAEHFLFRNGFYKQALNRIANYFITELSVECEDHEAKQKYMDVFEELKWRQVCGVSGLNLLSYSNEFITVNQGFERFLICPKCGRVNNIEKCNNYTFNKFKYNMTCLKCGYTGEHERNDKPSSDVNKIHIVHWPAKEIKIRYEDTTGEAEYFWDIPQQYIKKVSTKDNKFYSKKTPEIIYECILAKKLLRFNNRNFLHLKLDSPSTIRTDGKAIPLCMFLFEDLFMLQTLKRYNEVICFEDIAPFRVISMAKESNSAANPVFHQNGGIWAGEVDKMIDDHRKDPGSYHKFPFMLEYQQLGGEGKQLAPTEMMEAAKHNILNALDVPVEMFEMSFQQQAAAPMLRMFENAWTVIPNTYNVLLNHLADVIGKIQGLPKAKVSLLPITMSDDMERKSIVSQLVAANAISRSELLKTVKMDFEDQVRKKYEEDRITADIQKEEQEKDQMAASQEANMINMLGQPGQQGGAGGGAQSGQVSTSAGMTPQDTLANAQQIAQQLFPQPPEARRAQLQQIKAQDQDLYGQVKAQLEQLTSQAKSQGVQSAKQQGGQGGQGQ